MVLGNITCLIFEAMRINVVLLNILIGYFSRRPGPTRIMHQHAGGDIIGMIIRNLEVIDLGRAFEQLMLHFLHNDVFAVDEDENVTRAEVC